MAATKVFSGRRLREARKRAGVTAMDLAFSVGRTEQVVWGWERGDYVPKIEILAAIAHRLGVLIDDLFEDAADA
jgi:DNA-binding XRE family transcriptional regulator